MKRLAEYLLDWYNTELGVFLLWIFIVLPGAFMFLAFGIWMIISAIKML